MELNEIKTLIEEKLDNGNEVYESLLGFINDEKQKGIESHRKVNGEAKNLRKFKQSIEALGYNSEDDLNEFTNGIVTKIEDVNDKSVKDTLTLKTLNTKLKSLEDNLANEKLNSDKLRVVAKNKTIVNKLNSQIQDKFYASDLLISDLISNGKVDLSENGEVVFVDGEDVSNMADGVKSLMENRKDIVKNSQVNGAGTKVKVNKPISDINEILQSDDKTLIRNNLGAIKEYLES